MGSVRSDRFCLENSLPFRGHDESEKSLNKGKAKKNNKLTAPSIQKEIIDCYAKEVTKMICEEIKDNVFGLLVDESSDVSLEEQMAVVVRYVDRLGVVKESLIGIAHVRNTHSLTLKEAIVSLLADNQLSIDQVRGQGYDGASNMQGEFNGLKALILKDNPSAHYIHCFAHQLQLVIVAVAKKHDGVKEFYETLGMVVNTVGASCKRKDMMMEAKKERVENKILAGEINTGKGLNQEVSLARPGDTRWGSHHRTIISLLKLFPEVVEVLTFIKQDGETFQQRSNASGILSYFDSLEFVFYIHLLNDILGLTNALSKYLQKKSQDLLEASLLINGTKRALNYLRQNGFEKMLAKVTSFCEKNNILMLDMAKNYGNQRNRKYVITNRHHFEVEVFNTVLDMQIQELGNRFSEVSTSLIENMSGLNPCDSFAKFDIPKIVAFSKMYPNDFNKEERGYLAGDLSTFYHTLKEDDKFAKLTGLSDLARVMVENGKNETFPLVYRTLKLALLLPVATATVERCFFKNEAYQDRFTQSNG
ncbi:zinc finger MYM-type protein 1-like [Helianthus annuus]|uniref:zinc finger MYM-type protein 1-like n=1 Tax=Helianthus annuus TaxID=4232 RepID=UPI000B8FA48D|nr:zinc finger MYM-type protein 1-like [Helianthus annuus]